MICIYWKMQQCTFVSFQAAAKWICAHAPAAKEEHDVLIKRARVQPSRRRARLPIQTCLHVKNGS